MNDQNKPNGMTVHRVNEMFKDWFLDYASYVILERAIPSIFDGLKPVQRRILHSMKELDDGRYSKVANLVGNTMKYHPHGDASIYDAMVQIGNKELLIDKQGNWGNIYTGDGAAAARYIEARLTPFANEVVFSPKVTHWKESYDGRNKEPEDLPVKFPLLLFQGVEGIAVGLSTKIMPHNFLELIDASIKHLKGKSFEIFPDFPTGGYVDVSSYKDGVRGSKIRVRSKLRKGDNNTIVIEEIPFGTDTNKLIDSILKANDKGKIKIKKVEDNTAENVEIIIYLPTKVSVDQTIDALYVFTDCEMSISPLSCVIDEEKPSFVGVSEILKRNTDHTQSILLQELEIKRSELEAQMRNLNLERIFIENRVYRDIEEQTNWEGIVHAIQIGMAPHLKPYKITLNEDDIVRLTEIRIKKISKYDVDRTNELIKKIQDEIEAITHDIEHIVEFTIHYFKHLKKKYGKGRERKTEIRSFDTIDATVVAVNDTKLYVDREAGFIGTNLGKGAELVCECSSLDDILVIRKSGVTIMNKISTKVYMGKDILHVAIYNKADIRTVYNMVYREGKDGPYYMKRFNIGSLIRAKEYPLCSTKEHSKLMYFSANPNGEGDVVKVNLSSKSKARKTDFELDLSNLLIKSRSVKGNLVSKYPIRSVNFIRKGKSNLPAQKYWYDPDVFKVNMDGRGEYLNLFEVTDKLLHVRKDGDVFIKDLDTNEHFSPKKVYLNKLDTSLTNYAIYYDSERKEYYIKAFQIQSEDEFQKRNIIASGGRSYVELFAQCIDIEIKVYFSSKDLQPQTIKLSEHAPLASITARGRRLASEKVSKIEIVHIELPGEKTDDKADTNTKEPTSPSLFE